MYYCDVERYFELIVAEGLIEELLIVALCGVMNLDDLIPFGSGKNWNLLLSYNTSEYVGEFMKSI